MSMLKKKALAATMTAAILGLGSTSAFALQQGDWLARFGVTNVSPNDSSGDFSGAPGAGASVASDTKPSATITYMVKDNIGLELLVAIPFEHDISATGTLAAAGKVASTKQLPPTFSVQYHFKPQSSVRPYVGAGLNYTIFFDTETEGALAGTDLDIDNSFGLAAQVGVDFDISKNWFLNLDARYIQIETTATSSALGSVDVDINPWVITAAAGFRF